ncbi:acyl-CoA thioesterase [Hydrotalea sandarakina]|jgi:YbgC/YbaW family acyl-CoA thioester hydrolase|uniref:YbgC/YbaW family acyl-CoA thioester hydrolase n=1 Tax=Hydrotalea sandarakina TaxID=1004304 RepID=A0A2W7RVM8_9BACT|nr:thioesterase family protein [Hydrotalea sandarakina]PZX64758.1 YbgC/YbaW family acyl-CoA thioester hydrolase [Hydrotalea sandarakina]
MERIKLVLPEVFIFSTEMKIRVTDLNYGGHVGNDRFLALLQEARMEFLAFYGYSELNVEGVGLIIRDAAIEFKKELHYNQTIQIDVAITGIDAMGFDLYYKIHIKNNNELTLAATAKTGMLCYNYQEKKLAPVPAKFVEKMS